MLTALLMAGGKGERFWPKSRSNRPKQLLPISSDHSMIEETVFRISNLVQPEHIFVSTGQSIEKEIKSVLPAIPPENYIVEPVGRNTAPCIGLSALKIRKRLGNVPMAVLPADHVITNVDLFLDTLLYAARIAQEKSELVTIGIQPLFPHTGYGYIQSGEKIDEYKSIQAFTLVRFAEKPDRPTAEHFIETGTYFWNSGMFVWTCATILEEIHRYLPPLYSVLKQIEPALDTPREREVLTEFFPSAESISIDYGIMEKTDKGVVLKGTFDWDDVGGWLALEKLKPADANGNIVEGLISTVDTENCVILSDKQLVGTVGVKDLIVVSTPDAVLICHKSKCEDVKKLVAKLKADQDLNKYL